MLDEETMLLEESFVLLPTTPCCIVLELTTHSEF